MNRHLRGTAAGCLTVLLLIVFVVSRDGTSQAYSPKKGHQANGPFVPGRVLVQFRQELLAVRSHDVIAEEGGRDSGEIGETGVHIVELPSGVDEEAFLQAFQSRPEVEFAELDRIVPPATVTPNDFWFASEWHLPKIAAGNAWPITTGSSSITIAICDTGVDATHPDLAPKVVPGWNVYNNNSDTADVHGHGTQVAGAAASCSNNGIGVASVAWGCLIMPIRISDLAGNATYSTIASGITWAADHGARVANVSYIATDSSTVRTAAQHMQSRGGVVTVSAGNYSTFDSAPDNPYVLTVSATDISDVLSGFSNYGNNIDLAAPEAVYTTTRGGGYSYQGGTSFSAPIVAGVAALVLSAKPNLTGAQVQDILKQNADDLGVSGWDSNYGWGRINAARAVNAASGGGSSDTTPPTVGFSSPINGSNVSGTVSLEVTANDNQGVSSVSVSVDGTLLGADNVSPYAFSWNTSLVNNGLHMLTATASDAAGNRASASITVTVSNVGDTTSPTVTITSPANGATVTGNVSVLVNATDNVAVVKVELYVDGGLTSTSTSWPFTTKWNSKRAARGAHTLQAKGYDAAGNLGVSQAVTVYR
jgi:subtilisin family serine protease